MRKNQVVTSRSGPFFFAKIFLSHRFLSSAARAMTTTVHDVDRYECPLFDDDDTDVEDASVYAAEIENIVNGNRQKQAPPPPPLPALRVPPGSVAIRLQEAIALGFSRADASTEPIDDNTLVVITLEELSKATLASQSHTVVSPPLPLPLPSAVDQRLAGWMERPEAVPAVANASAAAPTPDQLMTHIRMTIMMCSMLQHEIVNTRLWTETANSAQTSKIDAAIARMESVLSAQNAKVCRSSHPFSFFSLTKNRRSTRSCRNPGRVVRRPLRIRV
jgi:hypothetical protein